MQLTVQTNKPIVMVGAMRPATAISADGPLNLLQAMQIARSPEAVGKGVLVTLNGTINCAREVVKQHTTGSDAFGNAFFGHIGFVQDGIARFYYESLRKHTAASEFARLRQKNCLWWRLFICMAVLIPMYYTPYYKLSPMA